VGNQTPGVKNEQHRLVAESCSLFFKINFLCEHIHEYVTKGILSRERYAMF